MKKTNLKPIFLLICIFWNPSFSSFWDNFAPGKASDYYYDNCIMKYRTLSGIKVKASDRFTFVFWRASYYRDWPLNQASSAERWGLDYHPAVNVNLGKLGPVQASTELAFYVLQRVGISEWRPRTFLNLNLPAGPVIIGLMNRLEYRMFSANGQDYKKIRWRPRVRLGTSWSVTSVKITPYFYWEGFFQKPTNIDKALGKSTKYQEVEAGLNSRLSDKITFGIGHMFQYSPDSPNLRGDYSAHRLSMYFFYTFEIMPQ